MRVDDKEFKDIDKILKNPVYFPSGLVGFGDFKGYSLEYDEKFYPFLKMVSLDPQGPTFIVVDPWLVKADYTFELHERELELNNESDLLCLVIVTLHRYNGKISANLMAPLVINTVKGCAKQIILDKSPYSTRHYFE